MNEICIFAGTTEGRALVDFCIKYKINVTAVVATEYGKELLNKSESIKILSGRMNCEEMIKLFNEQCFDMVLDATHPYAKEVSMNIKEACNVTGMSYYRICRRESESSDGIRVANVEEAVAYLSGTKGNVFAATGSKELYKYRKLADYRNRVYARILPDAQTIIDCMELGFERKNLICMQGPFSAELNQAMLKQVQAQWMVTKEAGKEGGFEEKIQAAKQAGVKVIIIGRPIAEEGYSFNQICAYLKEKYTLSNDREIYLAGIGMGTEETLTDAVKNMIATVQICIGAERMLSCAKGYSCDLLTEYQADKIIPYLKEHPEYKKIGILLSGDSGFYSGALSLDTALKQEGWNTTILPGISTVSYFCSKLHLPYQHIKTVSMHGRSCNIVHEIDTNEQIFVLLNGDEGVKNICEQLQTYHMDTVELIIGENLSYKEERILSGTAEEISKYKFTGLCAAIIKNNAHVSNTMPGIPDEEWIRGEIPMTKEEVRVISLEKLKLQEDSIVYDIGAGTGSVSIEAAKIAHKGTVYAIEKKAEGIELIRKNKIKFKASNVIPVYGTAPEAITQLEIPTHAFIGGSSGNLKDILRILWEKNPKINVIINTVTIETTVEIMQAMKELPFKLSEVLQIQIAKGREVGGSTHLMQGYNPITIFCCQGVNK